MEYSRKYKLLVGGWTQVHTHVHTHIHTCTHNISKVTCLDSLSHVVVWSAPFVSSVAAFFEPLWLYVPLPLLLLVFAAASAQPFHLSASSFPAEFVGFQNLLKLEQSSLALGLGVYTLEWWFSKAWREVYLKDAVIVEWWFCWDGTNEAISHIVHLEHHTLLHIFVDTG